MGLSVSHLFIRGEHFSIYKALGVFLGIIVINFNGASMHLSFGDIIIASSVAAVVGTVWSKKSVERASPFWVRTSSSGNISSHFF